MNQLINHIAVLVPARDEELLLPRCLYSIQTARRHLPGNVTSDVVIVSDCSKDRTAEIAEEILGDSGIVLCSGVGIVGSARAMAAKIALNRYRGQVERCWLANTDADCEVPAMWLANQMSVSARGFTAVAGTVSVDSFAEHASHVRDLFRLTYTINADGTHPHVHGANLGVRADAYLRAGGWSHLATAEDHDLWARLHSAGSNRLSDASLEVVTSGRRVGRAPLGFAGALAAHNEATSNETAA